MFSFLLRSSWSVLKTLVIAIPILLAVTLMFHERLIDSIYKNVNYSYDHEMPVSVTSYPSGPEVASIIGGAGEGLNCSLPFLADLLFDDGSDEDRHRHLVRQKFRQACVFHDLCYRHGLATYGYSQDDCDRNLQEQAGRLCAYLSETKRKSGRCQLDAKMVLAGVSLGGFDAYHAWDSSTYFEFDPQPLRSQEYSVSRVVDHPFKNLDPKKYANEDQQVILTFDVKRSEVKVACENCGSQTLLSDSGPPDDMSPELAAAGLTKRPEALAGRSLSLNEQRTVWLPPWRDHAAPHLIVDRTGAARFVWTSRLKSGNTVLCLVIADAAQLLTYTLPQTSACSTDARSTLELAEYDLLSGAPQPISTQPGVIVATGLTGQLGTGLQLCQWSSSESPGNGNAKRDCRPLLTGQGQPVTDLGAFQDFPIITSNRQIFITRAITDNPALAHEVTLWDRLFGDWYSANGRALVLDDPYGANGGQGGNASVVVRAVPFRISDEFDPMLPLSRSAIDNTRLISVRSEGGKANLYFVEFVKDWPTPTRVPINMDGADVVLHASWLRRPPIVVDSRDFAAGTSRLVLSRGFLSANEPKASESVLMEFLMLERGLADTPDKPYSVTTAAICKITYTIIQGNETDQCHRTFEPAQGMRSSPGALLNAGQMLVGRFNQKGTLGLALHDACYPHHPIILDRSEAGDRTLSVREGQITFSRSTRRVECKPLTAAADLAKAMTVKQKAAFNN